MNQDPTVIPMTRSFVVNHTGLSYPLKVPRSTRAAWRRAPVQVTVYELIRKLAALTSRSAVACTSRSTTPSLRLSQIQFRRSEQRRYRIWLFADNPLPRDEGAPSLLGTGVRRRAGAHPRLANEFDLRRVSYRSAIPPQTASKKYFQTLHAINPKTRTIILCVPLPMRVQGVRNGEKPF